MRAGWPTFTRADLAFGNVAAQIHLAQIEQRDDGRAGGEHFAGFGGAGDHSAIEGRGDGEIVAVGLGFEQGGPRVLFIGGGAGDIGLLLRDLAGAGCRPARCGYPDC